MSLQFTKELPQSIVLGIAIAKEITLTNVALLETKLVELLEKRKNQLSEEEDDLRKQVRNMLRNGTYRPTGRSKPASEYLVRAALEQNFPRINVAVDTINYLSLKYLVPISLWDIDLAQSTKYLFRLGKTEEKYIFNSAQQEISLTDLITGFALEDDKETPIITPVKDSLKTKTTDETKNIVMAIYYPTDDQNTLKKMLEEYVAIISLITSHPIETKIV